MIIGYGIYYFLNWFMARLVVHRKTELKNIYFWNFFFYTGQKSYDNYFYVTIEKLVTATICQL